MEVINQQNIRNFMFRRVRVVQNNLLYVGKLWYCNNYRFKLKSCQMWLIRGERQISAGFYKLVIFADYQNVSISLESQVLLNLAGAQGGEYFSNSGQMESCTDHLWR